MKQSADEPSNAGDVGRRLLYRSSNGDSWQLVKEGAAPVAVEHQPAPSSGGDITRSEIGAFLRSHPTGPQHDELLRLVGALVTMAEAGDATS